MNRIQEQALELLLEYQRACEALGLRYYLTAGTLLGAVRHKGFSPWLLFPIAPEGYKRWKRRWGDGTAHDFCYCSGL